MALHHSRAQVASIPEGKALLIRALRETNRNDLRTALWILSRTPLATRVDHATTATTDANDNATATATATDDVTVATDAVCCLEVNLRWLFSESNSSAILLETIGPDRVHTNLLRCLLEPQQYYLGLPVTETATTGATTTTTTTTTTTGVVTVTVVTTNAARHWLNPGVDSDSDSHFHFHSGHRGMTPLARACHRGNVDLARLFLEHGADPNACGADGVTPLIRAVKTGNVRVVNLLLELESEPESESECDESESQTEEPSKPKSKSKPNRNASSSRSSSSTTTATTVAAATTRWGTDLHRYDQQAMSALIHACTTEDHHAATATPTATATATATSISMTTTMAGALVAAAEATGTPARILVNAYRVDPPLWYASAHGRTRIVEWLIDDCSATASYRRQQTTTTTTTTTTTADTTTNTTTTQLYDVDVYSSTPLEEACEWGHTATVRALLERDGSDPRTATGRRARALAARAGHAGIAELLDRWAARLDKLESEYSEYPENRGGGGTIAAGDDAGCPRCEDDAATTTAATATTTTTTTATTTTTTTTTGVLLLPRVLSLTARRRDLAHRILCRNVGEILPFLE